MIEKPKTGEWWETEDGGRLFIVGYRRDKQIVFEAAAGIDWGMINTTVWRHLPDCTGFDCQEIKPEVSDRETEMIAALANLRDQQEKLQRRVERLEAEERRQRACGVV